MAAPVLNSPLWLEHAATRYPPLDGALEVDVAVVGAGITGATTAFLLAREGRSVALLEASAIAFGATGYTTAKLTVAHGLVYRDLVDSRGTEAARRYAASNREAIELVASLVAEHGLECDFERTFNLVYAESDGDAARAIRLEAEAARAAGVDAELTSETELPYPVAAAVRVDGQAQLHPWKYVAGLVRLVEGRGGRVFEETRATAVRSEGGSVVVETTGGSVRAGHAVVATQMPFTDRGLFFAKAHPVKSYLVAGAIDPEAAPRGMHISVDDPVRSVRSAPADDGRRLLLVGGEGHTPGDGSDANARYERLERFARERFGVEATEYRWSTHDFVPVDGLPYIGRLRGGEPRVLVATGFAKWGMTKGTLAASILADEIAGRRNPYADLYDATRLDPRRSAGRFVAENAKVGYHFVADRLRPRVGRDELERLEPGRGTVARLGASSLAVHRGDTGELHVLSARCPHLGCIVGWNEADRAWECPCHGSRFAADGRLLQGPATADLERRRLPE